MSKPNYEGLGEIARSVFLYPLLLAVLILWGRLYFVDGGELHPVNLGTSLLAGVVLCFTKLLEPYDMPRLTRGAYSREEPPTYVAARKFVWNSWLRPMVLRRSLGLAGAMLLVVLAMSLSTESTPEQFVAGLVTVLVVYVYTAARLLHVLSARVYAEWSADFDEEHNPGEGTPLTPEKLQEMERQLRD